MSEQKISDDAALKSILIYSDGACSGNPGPGGWGTIVARPDGRIRELGGFQAQTTNNQMEILGAIAGLREVRDDDGDVLIFTDSTYVIRGITQWIWGWQKSGWKTSEGKDVVNRELFQELAKEIRIRQGRGSIHWRYVKGHVGHPGNERVDEIAVGFSKGKPVRLYDSQLIKYKVPIYDLPPEVPLPEPKAPKEKKTAYSYLSLIGSQPMRHKTWPECESRVKGRAGARFKKAFSAEDEIEILRSWGVDPSLLQ